MLPPPPSTQNLFDQLDDLFNNSSSNIINSPETSNNTVITDTSIDSDTTDYYNDLELDLDQSSFNSNHTNDTSLFINSLPASPKKSNIKSNIIDTSIDYTINSQESSNITSSNITSDITPSNITSDITSSNIISYKSSRFSTHNHNHKSFSKNIRMTESNHDNLNLIIDCLSDMLIQENKQIEDELNKFINDLELSVPMNTFKISIIPHKYNKKLTK